MLQVDKDVKDLDLDDLIEIDHEKKVGGMTFMETNRWLDSMTIGQKVLISSMMQKARQEGVISGSKTGALIGALGAGILFLIFAALTRL